MTRPTGNRDPTCRCDSPLPRLPWQASNTLTKGANQQFIFFKYEQCQNNKQKGFFVFRKQKQTRQLSNLSSYKKEKKGFSLTAAVLNVYTWIRLYKNAFSSTQRYRNYKQLTLYEKTFPHRCSELQTTSSLLGVKQTREGAVSWRLRGCCLLSIIQSRLQELVWISQ